VQIKSDRIMENITQEKTKVKGWGIDADSANDPTYPMKHHTAEEHDGYSWPRPTQQPINIEVLHSNERPNVTAVFGTAVPPSGLSGIIRRFAFRFGEGSFGHWIPLVLADRINVIEGVIDDIFHGKFPNILAEQGIKAQWKYNRKGVLKRFAFGALFIAGGVAIYYSRKKR
jgi:hypothetical protein